MVEKTPEKNAQPADLDKPIQAELTGAGVDMTGEPPLQKSSDLEELECPNGLDSSYGSGEDTGDEEVESINDDSTASKPPQSKLFGQVKRPAVKSPEDPDGLQKMKKKEGQD